MYKVIINIPLVEDMFYLDKTIIAKPYETIEQAQEVFNNIANIFIDKFYKSQNTIGYFTSYTREYYYQYTDPYGDDREFYLGGCYEDSEY